MAQTVPARQANDPNTAQQTKPEERCSIEGTVSSLKTGQQLRKAELVLRRAAGNSRVTYTATTDAAGHYLIDNIEAGRYSLQASRNGYVNTSYGSEGKKRTATEITLSPAQHITKVDLRLPSQGVVAGHVVDEDGEPMAAVRVQLLYRCYQNGKPMLWSRQSATTDDRGEYRIFGVPAGKYWLSATMAKNLFSSEVDVSPSKKEQTSYPATYFPASLSVAEASQIQIAAGAEVDGIDFHLAQLRSFTVSGKVLNLRKNRDVNVQLLPEDSNGLRSWDRMKYSRADSEGKYIFQGLQSGRYLLVANIFSDEDRSSARSEVVVSDSDVDAPLVFGENPDLRGTLRSDDPADTLRLDMSVSLQPETPIMGISPAEVKDDGTFVLKSVPAERLRIFVHPLSEDHYIKSVQLGDTELEDTTVDLTNSAAAPLTITLSSKGAAISGTVQDDQQKSVSSGTVLLVPDDHKLQSRFRTASTDQNGQFTVKNIHPGSYKLFAFDSAENGIWLDPDWLKQYESKGESIEVKESEKATKNLILIVTEEQ